MIDVVLPAPPSTNNLTFNKARGRAATREYEIWKKMAGWELNIQKPQPITGQVQIIYMFDNKQKTDPDNRIKACNDLLVTHKLIDGDGPNIVRDGHWTFSDQVKGVRLQVKPYAIRGAA